MANGTGPSARGGRRSSGGWAMQIARPFGIPIRVHFTFALLLLWFGYAAWQQGEDPFLAGLFLILLFACVALHELGHALMAKHFGVKTREIVLYPIGGIASLDRMPSGKGELLIAIAGPLVNVALAGAMFIGVVAAGVGWPQTLDAWVGPGSLLPRLFMANIMLVLFNSIPAFPMDGGRVLRAILSFFMPHEKATSVAALVGQGVAILFGAAGLFTGNFLLIFIAFFVFVGAGQEAAFERSRAAVRGLLARDAMVTSFAVLAPQDTLARAGEQLLSTHQQDFPVIDAWGRVAGMLPRATLLEGLARLGRDSAVLEAMRRDVRAVSPETGLDDVLRLLQQDPGMPLVVLAEGKLVGMITLENLSELIQISQTLRTS